MGIQAVKLDTDGVATVVDLGENTLAGFYEHIGCRLVDVVRIAPDLDMWIDDEGALVESPVVNPVATALAAAHGFRHQPYVGTVVFTGGADDEGDTVECGLLWRYRILKASEKWLSLVPAGV